jgi:hypothetical protein
MTGNTVQRKNRKFEVVEYDYLHQVGAKLWKYDEYAIKT